MTNFDSISPVDIFTRKFHLEDGVAIMEQEVLTGPKRLLSSLTKCSSP